MAESKIEWTDATWNPVRGCTKVSPGCAHCYAETFAERFRGVKGHPYEQGFDLRLVPDKLAEPLHWKKPRREFVNSMSDLFHEGVPNGFLCQVFKVMGQAKQHTFQVLTKRADRMQKFMREQTNAHAIRMLDEPGFCVEWPYPNVWLGVSVEDQKRADERIPLLLDTPAAVRFLSVEPLLGPVSLTPWWGVPIPEHERPAIRAAIDAMGGIPPDSLNAMWGRQMEANRKFLHWVIVGGESGPGARRMDPAWASEIIDQCRAAGVARFFKQLGSVLATEMGCSDKKGGALDEVPLAFRVREYPKA